jgi:hypothetical protein
MTRKVTRAVSSLSGDRRSDLRLDQLRHLPGRGVTFQRSLAEDQLAVEDNLKPAAFARYQVDVLDDRRPAGQELVRQTDGLRDVVSRDAEFD